MPGSVASGTLCIMSDVEINLFEDTLQMQRFVRRSVAYEHYYDC
jgi:hypothetical protein